MWGKFGWGQSWVGGITDSTGWCPEVPQVWEWSGPQPYHPSSPAACSPLLVTPLAALTQQEFSTCWSAALTGSTQDGDPARKWGGGPLCLSRRWLEDSGQSRYVFQGPSSQVSRLYTLCTTGKTACPRAPSLPRHAWKSRVTRWVSEA